VLKELLGHPAELEHSIVNVKIIAQGFGLSLVQLSSRI
jgi:hypothetical protein